MLITTSVSVTIRTLPLVKAQTAFLKTKKNMAKNEFQYGGWNYYTLQCGTIMTLISPCDYTLQCGRWLWVTCHGIRPTVRRIGILHLVLILTISPQSTCHSAPVYEIFIQIGPPSAEKMTLSRFSRWRISAILDFRGPIMGSLNSPCTTSYKSSIETTALNCLAFEKIAF